MEVHPPGSRLSSLDRHVWSFWSLAISEIEKSPSQEILCIETLLREGVFINPTTELEHRLQYLPPPICNTDHPPKSKFDVIQFFVSSNRKSGKFPVTRTLPGVALRGEQPPATRCLTKFWIIKTIYSQFSKNKIPDPRPPLHSPITIIPPPALPFAILKHSPLPPKYQYRQQGDRSAPANWTNNLLMHSQNRRLHSKSHRFNVW